MYYECNGSPFECNYERLEARKLPDDGIEYFALVKKCNDKSEADREALELSMKPQQEHEAEIQAKIREMAIKELEKEIK